MRLRLLSAGDLRRALPMREAVSAMKDAFAALSDGEAAVPQRTVIPVPGDPGGTLLVKPAVVPAAGMGAKLVSVFPGNAELGRPVTPGLVVLLDPVTGEPLALADGTFLTAWRTGAASGVATDLLARPDVEAAAVFGCGGQAETQVLAIDAVRRLRTIRVYARTRDRVTAFVERLQPRVGAALEPAAGPDEAVDGAGVICTATTSATPVFDGRRLAAGAHVNGVGSFTREMQEIDVETVARARVFVDSRESALAEAGDLVIAKRQGATDPGDWCELGEVVSGARPGRRSDDEITFFKSVGTAVQDIVAGAVALRRAESRGLGQVVEW